ncbi:MAG TPA: carboxypeptidase-like regulatory domain-containing protein, partial [Gammaproteobacteria bacterium]|nr:carboxypeptidase-like regulatory domain-containing protein [Gammaproteobacteria bacterium]
MIKLKAWRRLALLTTAFVSSVVSVGTIRAQDGPAIGMDRDDIAGYVRSADGPEAGVWVIAETDELDTRFARIVVTDDAGRYLIPDLPSATYRLWVRGYGLADSEGITAEPGTSVDLEAVVAATPAIAAQAYPAAYWYAMMRLPGEAEVADIPGGLNQYMGTMKNLTCVGCHQLGQLSTRTLPEAFAHFESSEEAWIRRVSSGQAGQQMLGALAGQLRSIPFRYLGDWTDRVAAGELPSAQPARPAGIERNIVATVRDWGDAKSYLHDLISTDQRDPTLNGYGLIYGAPELSTDNFPILDPVGNSATTFRYPVRDADTPTTMSTPPTQASPYWGDEAIWDSQANAHNPMFDQDGRVWYTSRIRGPANPAFCREGSDHPSARLAPVENSGRHVSVYDPATGDVGFVDTCFSTHHLRFAEDADNTLWTSGGGPVVGWVDTNRFLETGDSAASQGWTALILDTNGN